MKNKMNIDKNKIYKIEVLDVKSTFRARYNRQGLQIIVLIKDLGFTVPRTFTLPASFGKASDCISRFLNPVSEKRLHNGLLSSPNLLAKEIKEQICGKDLGGRFEMNRAGDHINLIELFPFQEGA